MCVCVCVREREREREKNSLPLLSVNSNLQGRAMSDLVEGNKRLLIDSEILFQYFCFPKGDKHVLGFLFKSGVRTRRWGLFASHELWDRTSVRWRHSWKGL